jgi:hypothetical protein
MKNIIHADGVRLAFCFIRAAGAQRADTAMVICDFACCLPSAADASEQRMRGPLFSLFLT